MRPYTYVSLFSSAGVGCYGFKEEKYDCVLTNELVERRMEVQKCNAKCSDPRGYLCGDITDPEIQKYALNYINEYKQNKKLKDIEERTGKFNESIESYKKTELDKYESDFLPTIESNMQKYRDGRENAIKLALEGKQQEAIKEFDKVEGNIVLLTAKEHYMAHLLLAKAYPGNHKLVFAFKNALSHSFKT